MKTKYVKIERYEDDKSLGLYVLKTFEVTEALNNEFNDLSQEKIGTQILLTIIEMEPSEFQKLPDFAGY